MGFLAEQIGVKGYLKCDHDLWIVYPKDKVATRPPTGEHSVAHECPKIEVYRIHMRLARVYVIKGDLLAKYKDKDIKKVDDVFLI